MAVSTRPRSRTKKKAGAPRKAAPRKTASRKTAPRKTAPRKTAPRKTASRKTAPRKASKGRPARYWSHRVTETSDALDVEQDIFAHGTPRQIALSLKRSAERSRRRKSSPYRSAMSMLVFYINRGGKNLSASRLRALEQAKEQLRQLFER